jgi:hypothetical protein
MIWCGIPSTYFPLAAYIAFSICGGTFFASKISSNANSWKSQTLSFWRVFPYAFMYSFVGVSVSPLLLKVVDNKLFEKIVGEESHNFYLLAAYLMLAAIMGISVVKKIIGASFGDDVAKDFLEQMNLWKQTQVEQVDIAVANQISVTNGSFSKQTAIEFLEFIKKNPSTISSSIDQKFVPALDFIITRGLINRDEYDTYKKLTLSKIGEIYLDGKSKNQVK